MTEKTASLTAQAYEKIKENILNLTYPPEIGRAHV